MAQEGAKSEKQAEKEYLELISEQPAVDAQVAEPVATQHITPPAEEKILQKDSENNGIQNTLESGKTEEAVDYETLFNDEKLQSNKRIGDAQAKMTEATNEAAELRKRLGEAQSENETFKRSAEEAELNKLRTPINKDALVDTFGDDGAKLFLAQNARIEATEAENRRLSKTIVTQKEDTAQERANDAINVVYPDAEQIIFGTGKEDFDRWVGESGEYAQVGIRTKLQAGTPADIVKIISDYKENKKSTSNKGNEDVVNAKRLEMARKTSTPSINDSTPSMVIPKQKIGGAQAGTDLYRKWDRDRYTPTEEEMAHADALIAGTA